VDIEAAVSSVRRGNSEGAAADRDDRLGNSGLPIARSAVPGISGYRPSADQTYQVRRAL
jgi:hypothetical protein